MKNLFLGLALVAATVACKSEQKNAVEPTDASPAAEASTDDCAKPCCASECTGEKAAECSSEKKVCPVTGQSIN